MRKRAPRIRRDVQQREKCYAPPLRLKDQHQLQLLMANKGTIRSMSEENLAFHGAAIVEWDLSGVAFFSASFALSKHRSCSGRSADVDGQIDIYFHVSGSWADDTSDVMLVSPFLSRLDGIMQPVFERAKIKAARAR